MPTGYTDGVGRGKVTEFRDFALACARAFGALVEMRDDPSDYHEKAIHTATVDLIDLRAMTQEQVEAKAQEDATEALRSHEKREDDRRMTERRYRDMLAKVQAWTPPTKDHAEMRRFMENQLTESIRFDCSYRQDRPKAKSAADWRKEREERLMRDVAYHTVEHEKEIARCKERSEWVKALRASLEESK